MLEGSVRHPVTDGRVNRLARQSRLNASHHEKNDDNQEQKAKAAARVISPGRAVWPSRQRTEQDNDHDDEQNRAKHCDAMILVLGNKRQTTLSGSLRNEPGTILSDWCQLAS